MPIYAGTSSTQVLIQDHTNERRMMVWNMFAAQLLVFEAANGEIWVCPYGEPTGSCSPVGPGCGGESSDLLFDLVGVATPQQPGSR